MEVMYRQSNSEEFRPLGIDIGAIMSARTASSIDEHYPALLNAPKNADVRVTRDLTNKDGVSNSLIGYLVQSRKLSDIQVFTLIEATNPRLDSLCSKESFKGREDYKRYSSKGLFALAVQANFNFTVAKLMEIDLPIGAEEAKACAKALCEQIKYKSWEPALVKRIFEHLFSKGANLDFKISNKHPVEYIGSSCGEELSNYLRSASLASKAETITKTLNESMDNKSKEKAVESTRKITRGMSL